MFVWLAATCEKLKLFLSQLSTRFELRVLIDKPVRLFAAERLSIHTSLIILREADRDEDLVTMITMMRSLILKLPYLKEIQISPELGHTNVKALMLAYFRYYGAIAGVASAPLASMATLRKRESTVPTAAAQSTYTVTPASLPAAAVAAMSKQKVIKLSL